MYKLILGVVMMAIMQVPFVMFGLFDPIDAFVGVTIGSGFYYNFGNWHWKS